MVGVGPDVLYGSLVAQLRHDAIRGRRQIVIDLQSRRVWAIGQGLGSLAGADQHRSCPDLAGRYQVTIAIADHGDTVEVDAQAFSDCLEHADAGFSTLAACAWRVGAEKNGFDYATHLGELAVHALVDSIERVHVHQLAADRRLVCSDDDTEPRMMQTRDGLQTSVDGSPFIGGLYIVGRVVVDDPIPVQYNETHTRIRLWDPV